MNDAPFLAGHSTSDSETTNRKIFDYIGAVWGKLEPDCKPCVNYSNPVNSSPKDVSSTVGDYAVRNAFNTPKNTPFTDEEDDGYDLDTLIGDNSGEDDFWKAFGKG